MVATGNLLSQAAVREVFLSAGEPYQQNVEPVNKIISYE
jgi:hypothetical protein